MYFLHPTQKWTDEVIRLLKESFMTPEDSKFVIAFFSSMDWNFVRYFKERGPNISSQSGNRFHVFVPLIRDENTIPDDEWRGFKRELKGFGLPIKNDPTFIFFRLRRDNQAYEPDFFAAFSLRSFNGFNEKFRNAIEACIENDDIGRLTKKLEESFAAKNLISGAEIAKTLTEAISDRVPKTKVFISYSRADEKFVDSLVTELSTENADFWISLLRVSLTFCALVEAVFDSLPVQPPARGGSD